MVTIYEGLMNKHRFLVKTIMVEIFYGSSMAYGRLLDVSYIISLGCQTRIGYPSKPSMYEPIRD